MFQGRGCASAPLSGHTLLKKTIESEHLQELIKFTTLKWCKPPPLSLDSEARLHKEMPTYNDLEEYYLAGVGVPPHPWEDIFC